MEREVVRVKKLRDNAVLPEYGSVSAAGADLRAAAFKGFDGYNQIQIEPGKTMFVLTGLAMEIPDGKAGHIYARSGLSCKSGLAPANKVGVVDSDYRGEIMVALHNHSDKPVDVKVGDKVAQMEIVDVNQFDFCECDELDDTERGAGGFGSTGK